MLAYKSSLMAPPFSQSQSALPLFRSMAILSRLAMMMMMMMMTVLMVFININTAYSHSVIENLPGFPGILPFKLETGYIGVGEKDEAELFYYFIESERSPEDDPLLLWLTGGPGCSGLSGLLYEIGPLAIDYANSYRKSIPALTLNEYSWTKVANIIFLDEPVGTGFSYAKTREASFSSDTSAANNVYDFLIKWLINHPKYLKNPLYICGDSYSGILVPLVVDLVYDGMKLGLEPQMNLKGYVLGNPTTDAEVDHNALIQYAYRMGLLSDRLYQSVKEACHGDYIHIDPENVLCQNALERVQQCLEKIRTTHILEPSCRQTWKPKGNVLLGHSFSYENIPTDFLLPAAASTKPWCRENNYYFSSVWANDKSVQKALHVREGTKMTGWSRCNRTIGNGGTQPDGTKIFMFNVPESLSYHQKFTHTSFRVLIYSGDHDMMVPHTGTERWIDSLQLPIQEDWRPWIVEDQIAGYATIYAQDDYELTYATVKGAGHTAPEYKPKECFEMIARWFGQSAL